MMQESVYVKMVLNSSVQKSVMDTIVREKPSNGLVQCLTITEKQFSGIVNIVGEYKTNVIDTDERLLIL